jgi:hypothetical protein
VLGETVIARVEKECVIAGTMKMRCQWKHQSGVTTPTVENDDRRRGAFRRDEPTMKFGAVGAA